MQTPQSSRLLKAVLSRLPPAPADAANLTAWAAIVQIGMSFATLAGLIVFGGWAIQRLDLRIKSAEVESKEIGASYDKQHRIRIDHSIKVESVQSATADRKSANAPDTYEAAVSFKVTNTSKSEYSLRRVEVEFLKGEIVRDSTSTTWFRINLPMQNETHPVRWTPLQIDAYVVDNGEADSLKQERPIAKNHGIGPTGRLNSDETADWEEDYRFGGALGDFVGAIVLLRYADNEEWCLQEWSSIPKTVEQKTPATPPQELPADIVSLLRCGGT